MHPKKLSIKDFTYFLPEEKIASHPVHPRSASKLLIYKQGTIEQDVYKNIGDYLPEEAVLIFNNTRVIKSRILFQKESGAIIEVFCLEPQDVVQDYEHALSQKKTTVWKCLVGKANKWKEQFLEKELVVDGQTLLLKAELLERLSDAYLVRFTWDADNITFLEIMESAGQTPLPPYIKRAANLQDETDYQTVYSKHEGSVASPTAGLHFTDEILHQLREKNISTLFTTLHVGAGTFKPVKSETMEGHHMHSEWMHISLSFLKDLEERITKKIISVGTTATRTLESIYWMGNKILNHPDIDLSDLKIQQWEVYENTVQHSPQEAVIALQKWMESRNLEELFIETEIIIAPGYSFQIVNGLITNFHQPQSTLLLLVAALLGDSWKKVYEYALDHDFRFLSYGDGSLLLPLS